jgi:cell division transport system ATP-binding protein
MLQLFHVHKQYRGEAPALADVSLRVSKGEFVFLTGPSGAGKSTLLRLAFCAEAATSGQLIVLGRNVAKLRPLQVAALRRSIGVVFQDFKLLPLRTVAENVAFPLEVRGLAPREVRRRVAAMLRTLGLELRADRFPLSLSGGEQQRVAVARSLAARPRVLLADEPTSELDSATRERVIGLLRGQADRGAVVVLTTHDRAAAAAADVELALDEGRQRGV